MFQSSDVVFHLASAVSGECEQDLSLIENESQKLESSPVRRLRVLNIVHCLFSRALSPSMVGQMIFPLPADNVDDVRPNPQNSYGSQKLILRDAVR